ncbi:protein preY, mitochondrial isoform X1 [Hemicordylus capensis]|uniref:protein preY, mitochondrial isoform X1 n=1 Tax=Hemicordylus capensis TaxID=884348 RepID=UPI002303CB1C|nr:protein preY, mitochondrial isoform X1 [Hemicordylus capensis]
MLALPAFRLLARLLQHGKPIAAVTRRAFCAEQPANDGRVPVSASQGQQQQPPFDLGLLEILVCPLSKKPLRFDESTNELINEELGIAYPIIDGIPNMIPQAARMIKKEKHEREPKET